MLLAKVDVDGMHFSGDSDSMQFHDEYKSVDQWWPQLYNAYYMWALASGFLSGMEPLAVHALIVFAPR